MGLDKSKGGKGAMIQVLIAFAVGVAVGVLGFVYWLELED